MSLLIDALKQAEAARKPSATVALERRADLALAPVDEEIPATAAQRTVSKSTPQRKETVGRTETQQAEARELFEIKQQTPSGRWPVLLAIAGFFLLAAGSGYIWWVTQPRELPASPGIAALPPLASQARILVTDPLVPPPPAHRDNASDNVNHRSDIAERPNPSIYIAANKQQSGQLPLSTLRESTRDKGSSVQSYGDARPVVDIPKIQHKAQNDPVAQPSTSSAYQAYMTGDLSLSQSRYRDAMKQEPASVDILNALGTIALREGRPAESEHYFRGALSLNPKDATALAQLVLMQADGDTLGAESKLKLLTIEQPESAVAFFSLGSLYAQQGRWHEAQQAFFRVLTLDAGHADALYNLAVSLDHLGQTKLASQYYDRAIHIAQPGTATFNVEAARGRARMLSDTEAASE